MINKRLLAMAPAAMQYIKKNVFFQWLSLIANTALSTVFAVILTRIVSGAWILSPALCLLMVAAAIPVRAWSVRAAGQNSVLSSLEIKEQMRESILAKVMQIGPGYTRFWNTSELVQLVSEGVEQLETYFASYVPQFFYALLAPLTLFLFTLFLDWKSALVLLICVPLIPVSIVLVQKFAKKLLNKYWGQYTQLSDSFLENLQGLTTLKIYQADEEYHQKMNREAENFRKITMRVLIMQLNSISVMDLVAYGGAAAGILTAVFSLRAGNIPFFQGILIVLLSAEFFIPMRQLGSYFHVAMNGAAAADKMFGILDHPLDEGRIIDCTAEHPSVSASHLSFTYPEGKEAIRDISFDLPGKGFYGIVGKSGCGKSTLASLLVAKNTGYEGSLNLNEDPVSEVTIPSLMKTVALLSHESWLFEGTVRSNLCMADPDASDEACWQALEDAGIADFLRKGKGLDTAVLEGGKNFSGGQKQRIALARMLLADTPVLILDEATSNIDAYSENKIMKAVEKIARERLVLCISHRLANTVPAASILVMKDGRIVQQGTHEQLLSVHGVYSQLWNAQKELEAYVKGGSDEEE